VSEAGILLPTATEPRLRSSFHWSSAALLYGGARLDDDRGGRSRRWRKSLGESPLRLNLVITTYLLSLAVFIRSVAGSPTATGAPPGILCRSLDFRCRFGPVRLVDEPADAAPMRVVQGFRRAMMTPVGRLICCEFPRTAFVIGDELDDDSGDDRAMVGPVVGGSSPAMRRAAGSSI